MAAEPGNWVLAPDLVLVELLKAGSKRLRPDLPAAIDLASFKG